LCHGGRDHVPEEEKEYLDKRVGKKKGIRHSNLIKEFELSSPLNYKNYNSLQTFPYTLQTVAQPDFWATKYKPV
jgi:hypothetical protein